MNRKLPKNKTRFIQVSQWLTCILLSGFLISCEEDCIFHQYKHTGKGGWDAKDTLYFEIPITDSLTTYRVDLELRNHTIYKFREVYLMIEASFQQGKSKTSSADLVCFPLTDEEGKWLGIGWGNTLQSSVPFRDLYFTHSGTLKCKIYHKMNVSRLEGIPDVGLKIKSLH